MNKYHFAGAALAVTLLVGAPLTASADELPPTTQETTEAVYEAPVAAEAVFTPYGTSERWLIPASWDFNTTPYYTAAIFDQTRLGDAPIPCGQWSQDDNYWIENAAEEQVWLNLGDTLHMGEDSSIYASHTFTKGPECDIPDAPTPIPIVAPTTNVLECYEPGQKPSVTLPVTEGIIYSVEEIRTNVFLVSAVPAQDGVSIDGTSALNAGYLPTESRVWVQEFDLSYVKDCVVPPSVVVITPVAPVATSAPSCDTDGSYELPEGPHAQNHNPEAGLYGVELDGYHLYVRNTTGAFGGPGVYTWDAYGIGAAGNAQYPLGTSVGGKADSQGNPKAGGKLSGTFEVLAATGTCVVTEVPPVEGEPEAVPAGTGTNGPVVSSAPVLVERAELAATGGSGNWTPWMAAVGFLGALMGAILVYSRKMTV